MTVDEMRALLGLDSDVSDAEVMAAYDAWLASQPVPSPAASPATFKLRYPAFSAVASETITYWLTDALRVVTADWGSDADPAQMALAAHNMVLAGVPGIATGSVGKLPDGVTKFRSADVDVSISETAANRLVAGGYGATRYGLEFQTMLRRNAGGPFLVGCA
ncbi:hypothetical protein GCM10011380_00630 [Sphingomonas metalli]|uniref:DUF4054 domain-containing protein n=1 Tax=Sphingomonas metalli TaxID=1779358 RepID=A0A916SUZ5_9SPHN|nr:DUF4054 domain-containing protein [Sphingomonas metalli]GGB15091.1 hypothetical protein GCM10011380_00630 [Sphingomonas metalli]